MRIFKTKWFNKWAKKEGLDDHSLQAAVKEMAQGLIDANLGGHVFKKRVGISGRGKSAGVRTLLAFKIKDRAFFLYGFAKNQQENISDRELQALKLLASQLLTYNQQAINKALETQELLEMCDEARK